MKLIGKPTVKVESISVPRYSFKFGNIFKGKSPIKMETLNFAGRRTVNNIFIESEQEFPLGVRIESLMVPGEQYEFFGLIPIERVGNITEFTVDYFEI